MELKGTAASPGVAVGPAFWLRGARPTGMTAPCSSPETEQLRVRRAVAEARAELEALRKGLGAEAAEIFGAHVLMLEDPELQSAINEAIAGGDSAEVAVDAAVTQWRDVLASLDDPYLRARAIDVVDVGQRLRRLLTGEEKGFPVSPSVILAEDLTPSQTAELRGLARAFVLSQGGPTSHAAILASAWGIPAVTGVQGLGEIAPGTELLVDGDAGSVYISPKPEVVATMGGVSVVLLPDPDPAVTKDGYCLEVAANAAGPEDATRAAALGAEGIGLLRSELLFLDRLAMPSEHEQTQVLEKVLGAMNGRPVILRALDVGGDKPLPYLPTHPEANPFLGLRGIRLLLGPYRDVFAGQIRAAASAAGYGPLKFMLPMVSTVDEVIEARQLMTAQGAESLSLGIMVETPAAALNARSFAALVDFFSIGTNDLTQYTLAVDRGNRYVANLYDSLHPSVLRLIKATTESGVWTGICGELAADPLAVPLWIAWGVREVSMSPAAMSGIKRAVRLWTRDEALQVAAEALQKRSAAEVRDLLVRRKPLG